jgi:hypothetical protein
MSEPSMLSCHDNLIAHSADRQILIAGRVVSVSESMSCIEITVRRAYLEHTQLLVDAKALLEPDAPATKSLLATASDLSTKRSIPILPLLECAMRNADIDSQTQSTQEQATAATTTTTTIEPEPTSTNSSTTSTTSSSLSSSSVADKSTILEASKRSTVYENLLALLPSSVRLSQIETRIAAAYLQYAHQELFLLHSLFVMHEEIVMEQIRHVSQANQVCVCICCTPSCCPCLVR